MSKKPDDIRGNVPAVRFREFQGEWETLGFENVFEILKNFSYSRECLNDERGCVRNVHYGDVLIKYGDCINAGKENLPYITGLSYDKKNKDSYLLSGDVIFADTAEDSTAGKCSEIINIKDEPILSGLHTIPVRPQIEFAIPYLGYYLNSSHYHNQLLPKMQGTKVVSISKSSIKDTLINYPSRSEQQSIAIFFDRLDTLIRSNEQQLEKLRNIKQASLKKMFPSEGQTTPKVRLNGFNNIWNLDNANNIFKTYDKRNKPFLPVLSATQERGMVSRASFGYEFSHDEANEVTYKHILPGQFVIHLRSFQGGFAHSAIEGIASPAYTVFEFKNKEKYNDIFWKYVFMSKSFIKRLELITYGIRDGRSISFSEFSSFEFFVPSLPEQIAIAEYFTNLDTLIHTKEKQLEKLCNIKKASLNKMFV